MTGFPTNWDRWPMWRKRYWLFRRAEGYSWLKAMWWAWR